MELQFELYFGVYCAAQVMQNCGIVDIGKVFVFIFKLYSLGVRTKSRNSWKLYFSHIFHFQKVEQSNREWRNGHNKPSIFQHIKKERNPSVEWMRKTFCSRIENGSQICIGIWHNMYQWWTEMKVDKMFAVVEREAHILWWHEKSAEARWLKGIK